MGSDKQQVWLSNMLGSLQKRGRQWILTINIRGWSGKTEIRSVFWPWFNGLVWGKIYRKPWFLPSNIGVSCKFSHHPILRMVDFNPNDSTTSVADVQVLSSSRRAHCWNNHPLKSNVTFPRSCQDPVAVLPVARTISFRVTTCDSGETWISPSPTLVNNTNCFPHEFDEFTWIYMIPSGELT